MPEPAPRTPELNDADARRAEKALRERVAQARAAVRRVDLTTAFCAFATLALGVLFLGVLLDHWVLPDGLSPRGRLFFVIGWVASTTLYFVVRLVPILRRQIAPLYAAKILEESWNDPHNSAISWLQLRREAADARRRSQKAQKTQNKQENENAQNVDDSANFAAVDPSILRGVALQAANRAASAPSETLVDCSGLIRWGVAFAVVVAVCGGYSVFSPKSPFASVGRIVAPTAAIERPQAVALEEVSPGDATVYQGDFLDVAAKIDGAGSLPVEIFYSTEDGRLVDLRVPMKPVGASRFEARFPDGDAGFSEPSTYRVVVGAGGRFESVSPTYRVDVKPRPSFQVEKTTLKFPDYTGLTPQTFANQGDVRAVEGTTVEIVARSNSPLESALFLPNGDESKGAKMTISAENPRLATFAFRLDWKPTSSVLRSADAEEKVPALTSYRLLSIDVDGQRNRDARDYSVETLVDVPPTIRWESAPESGANVPLNDALRFQVWAEDPDFGLRAVRVRSAIRDLDEGASAGRATPKPIDLPLRSRSARSGADYSTGPTPFVGPNVLSGALVPAELGFQVGDEIEYWVEVLDSKEPEANVAATEKLLFVVGEPVANPSSPDAPPEEAPENPENGESGSESGGENGEAGQNSEEQQSGGESQTSENGEKGENGEAGQENQSGQNQQGEQAGQNAQNQQGGQNNQSEQSAQNEQGGENGQSSQGAQNGQEGQNAQGGASDAASGDDSNASEQAGESGQTPQNGENEQSRESEQNSENAQNGEANSPASGAPKSVDPESNPGDAFEKALDFIRSERENAQNGNSAGEDSDAEPSENGRSGQNKEDGENAQSGKSANDAQNGEESQDGENPQTGETGESGEDREKGEKSNERRPLPNRTSDERPSDDAERFDAEKPEKIDPNSRREKGEVDPNANDFLAQNAPADAPENPNGAPQDANVLADPLANFAGSGADVAPNAQELKGANNAETDPNGASEPDRDPSGGENGENGENGQTREAANPDALPNDALGGGGAGNDSASDATGSNENNEKNGGGSASDQRKPSTGPKSEDQEGTVGAGGDSQSGKRGGGGGSGLGELGPDEASLTGADAPRLQYAEAATNLVLDYLDAVLKEKADRRILDELGWTEEQLRAFLERWQAMKASAEAGNENAKVEYLQALENLGLDAPDASEPLDATRGRAPDDRRPRRNDAVREDRRTQTPNALDERVRAFNRGVSTRAGR